MKCKRPERVRGWGVAQGTGTTLGAPLVNAASTALCCIRFYPQKSCTPSTCGLIFLAAFPNTQGCGRKRKYKERFAKVPSAVSCLGELFVLDGLKLSGVGRDWPFVQ